MRTKKCLAIFTGLLGIGAIFIVALKALADPPQPVIAIAPLGTNQFSVTVANGTNSANYDLYWTPILADTDYPWTVAAIGNTGQTNFVLNMGMYSSGFFRVLLETTNGIPPWKAADPNNPNSGVLAVTIDSPANSIVLP